MYKSEYILSWVSICLSQFVLRFEVPPTIYFNLVLGTISNFHNSACRNGTQKNPKYWILMSAFQPPHCLMQFWSYIMTDHFYLILKMNDFTNQ